MVIFNLLLMCAILIFAHFLNNAAAADVLV